MSNTDQELHNVVLKLGLLVRGYVQSQQRSEAALHEFEHKYRELERRCTAIIELNQRQHVRERHQSELRKRMAAQVQEVEYWAQEAHKWRERYGIVDKERADLQAKYDELTRPTPEHDDLPVIDDIQVCLNCGLEHLVAERDDVYRCLGCNERFRVPITYPAPRPASAGLDRHLDDDGEGTCIPF